MFGDSHLLKTNHLLFIALGLEIIYLACIECEQKQQ